LTKGILIKDKKFYSLFWMLALPLTLQQLLLISVDALNTLMLGQFSEIEMTAVSQASQVFFVFSVICYGFASACCIIVSQYYGKKDTESIKTIIALTVRLNALFGLVVSTAVFIFPTAFMSIYSRDPRVIALGALYLRVVALMYMPFAVSTSLFYACRGVEETKIVIISNSITYSINIILNYIFIFGFMGAPKLGVLGAAIGTVISRYIEFAIMCVYMLRIERHVKFRLSDLMRRNAVLRKDYLVTLRPVLGHEVIWSFGMTMPQAFMGQLGTAASAAFNTVYVFFELLTAVLNGMGGAATVAIGKAVGEDRMDVVKKESYTILLMATLMGAAGAICLLAGFGGFLSFFRGLSGRTVQYALGMAPVMAMVTFFSGWEVVGLVGILRGGGDARTGFRTDCVAMWLIAIPLGALATFYFKLSPIVVIALLKVDMPIKATVGLIRVLRMHWVTNITRDFNTKPAND
jgi:putative MATE family efflux protein